MILERIFYGIKCDGCGKVLLNEYNEDAYYDNSCFIEEVANDSGWIKIRDKHYCEDCHHYGDNDELILGDGTTIQTYEDDWL